MGDNVYYQWLPYVDNWVKRWASQDFDLRPRLPELIEDARSYAYLLWLEIAKKMPDEVSAEKYYKSVVHKRLDTYMNKYYKNQYLYYNKWSDKDGDRVIPYKTVYADAPIATTEKGVEVPLWDVLPIDRPSPEDTYIDNEEQRISRALIDVFIAYATPNIKPVIEEIVNNALTAMKKNPDIGQKDKYFYDINQVALNHNMTYGSTIQAWNKHKKHFIRRYPAIIEYLQTNNVEALNKILED